MQEPVVGSRRAFEAGRSSQPRHGGWAMVVASIVASLLGCVGCGSSETAPTDAGHDQGHVGHDAGMAMDVVVAFCEGGFVRAAPDGGMTCEGLCKPSLCKNANNVCVDNDCVLQCTSDLDCQLGQNCAPATEDGTGKMITTCQSDGKGGIGTKCPLGTECANVKTCADGSPCPTSGSCAKGTCAALTCLSHGAGDPGAYCTLVDCHADSDCPNGYWCDPVDTSDAICGKPAPDPFCGTSTGPCVDPANDAKNGTTYAAGNVCALRNECRVRSACSPCATDIDCSLVPGQHCVKGACAADCTSDSDCLAGYKCTSGECVTRFGSCSAAPGTGVPCQPCQNDTQCGKGMACAVFESGGLRTCLFPTGAACTMDTDCPKSPSGLMGICGDGRLGLGYGQPGYHTCFPPFFPGLNKLGCWAQNKGAPCTMASDCVSNSCQGNDAGTLPTCD